MNAMLLALAAYLTGHWSCVSGSQSYTTDWAAVTNTHWVRGINTAVVNGATSTSEDMETYDDARGVWRIVDMESNGAMSVLEGQSSDPKHVSTQSTYPDASQRVRYDVVSHDEYTLTFDFIINGKPSHWVDDCKRE